MFHKYWRMLALSVSLCLVSAYPISGEANVGPICVFSIYLKFFLIVGFGASGSPLQKQ